MDVIAAARAAEGFGLLVELIWGNFAVPHSTGGAAIHARLRQKKKGEGADFFKDS